MLCLLLGQSDVAALEARVARSPHAANYRALADAYLNAEQYQKASGAFSKAAVLYGKMGDPNAAEVLRSYAKRYATSIRLFIEEPYSRDHAAANYSGAKFEPLNGCYVGANIEREKTRDADSFNHEVSKRHATFFMYRTFGADFPTALANELRGLRAGLQIAWEPRNLNTMDDYATVSKFAQAAAKSGIPIFLRFASEMNGPWTPYHGNPALYREKFRTVSRIVKSIAPNVAMVWCPNETPEDKMDAYFPGDDVVDWVGVNFYSVIYNDGNRARAAAWRNPLDSLDYVYERYSAKHPIMVGEWAATHRSVLDSAPNPGFAQTKIAQFYGALPKLYPRVKAVHWLSMSTMVHASGPRKLNDFSLLSDASVARRYADVLRSPYYLETCTVGDAPTAAVQFMPLKAGMLVPYGTKLCAVVRSYEQKPRVTVSLGGKQAFSQTEVGDYSFVASTAGKVDIVVTVSDSKGRTAGTLKVPINVR